MTCPTRTHSSTPTPTPGPAQDLLTELGMAVTREEYDEMKLTLEKAAIQAGLRAGCYHTVLHEDGCG